MFTPVILACTTSACIVVGGPGFSTEDECHQSAMTQGIPYVIQTYPEHQVVDYKCIAWGTPA